MTKRVQLLVGLAIVALLVMLASWKPAAIAYHRRHMMSAFNDMGSDRQGSRFESFWNYISFARRNKSLSLLDYERYEYHRDKLVEWGDLAHREFVLQHIVARSDEAKELWRRLQLAFPDNIHATSDWPSTPEPMRIDVSGSPGRIAHWDAFVAEHDVPDFRTRFLTGFDEDSTIGAQDEKPDNSAIRDDGKTQDPIIAYLFRCVHSDAASCIRQPAVMTFHSKPAWPASPVVRACLSASTPVDHRTTGNPLPVGWPCRQSRLPKR